MGRSNWVLCDDTAATPSSLNAANVGGSAGATASSSSPSFTSSTSPAAESTALATCIHTHQHDTNYHGGHGGEGMGLPHEQVGLYVRSQCLPFIEAGCSSWGESLGFYQCRCLLMFLIALLGPNFGCPEHLCQMRLHPPRGIQVDGKLCHVHDPVSLILPCSPVTPLHLYPITCCYLFPGPSSQAWTPLGGIFARLCRRGVARGAALARPPRLPRPRAA